MLLFIVTLFGPVPPVKLPTTISGVGLEEEPVGPVIPIGPVLPVGPVTVLAAPVGPVYPVGPVLPIGPVLPV